MTSNTDWRQEVSSAALTMAKQENVWHPDVDDPLKSSDEEEEEVVAVKSRVSKKTAPAKGKARVMAGRVSAPAKRTAKAAVKPEAAAEASVKAEPVGGKERTPSVRVPSPEPLDAVSTTVGKRRDRSDDHRAAMEAEAGETSHKNTVRPSFPFLRLP